MRQPHPAMQLCARVKRACAGGAYAPPEEARAAGLQHPEAGGGQETLVGREIRRPPGEARRHPRVPRGSKWTKRRQREREDVDGKEAASCDAAERIQSADGIAQVDEERADVDEVERADESGRRVVDGGVGRARRWIQVLPALLRTLVHAAGVTPAHHRPDCSEAGQSHAAGSEMSRATTSSAPRRSISNAQKPSQLPTSRQR